MPNIFPTRLVDSVNGLIGKVKLSVLKSITTVDSKLIFLDQDDNEITSIELPTGNLKTDGDLYIEDGVIRNNISSFWSEYTWYTGDDKIFSTPFDFTEVTSVIVNGDILGRKEYRIMSLNKVEILKELNNDSNIEIRFNHFITQ